MEVQEDAGIRETQFFNTQNEENKMITSTAIAAHADQKDEEKDMTKKEFQELAASDIVLLDGATGSNFRKAGMPVGVSTELWAMEHPDVGAGAAVWVCGRREARLFDAPRHFSAKPTWTGDARTARPA